MKEELIKAYNEFVANGKNVAAIAEAKGVTNAEAYLLVKMGERLVNEQK